MKKKKTKEDKNKEILKSYLTKELNRVKDEIDGAKDQVSGYKSMYDSARFKLNELKIVEISIKAQLKEN